MPPTPIRNTVGEKTRGHFNDMYTQLTGKSIQEVSDSELMSQIHASSIAAPSLTSKPPKKTSESSKKKSVSKIEKVPDIDVLNNNSDEINKDTTSVWEDFKSVLPGTGSPSKLLKGFGESTFGKGTFSALDVISRPFYAMNSGLEEMAESINRGEPFWSLPDDLIWGAGQGLAGFRKSGFGDHVQTQTEYNSDGQSWGNRLADFLFPTLLGPGLGNMTKEAKRDIYKQNPDSDVLKWMNRTEGFVGDIVTDPTTWMGGKVITIAADAAEKGGRAVLKETGKEALSRVTKEAAREAAKDIPAIAKVKVAKGTRDVARFEDFTEKAVSKVDELLDDLSMEIRTSSQAGKIIGSIPETASTLSTHFGNEARTILRESLDAPVREYLKMASTGKIDPVWLARESADNELVKAFHEGFQDALSKSPNAEKAKEAGLRAADELMEPSIAKAQATMLLKLKDSTLRIPSISVMGRNVASFPMAAKRLKNVSKRVQKGKVGNKLGDTAHSFNKAMNYAANLPGGTSLITGRLRAAGAKEWNDYTKVVRELKKGVTREEKVLLQKALMDGSTLFDNPKLAPILLKLRAMYDELFLREEASLTRTNATRVDNYAYMFLRGRELPRNKFIEQRRLAVAAGKGHADFGLDAAKAAGLNPIEDAFTNLLYRKQKSMRQLNRAAFNTDVAVNYGIFANDIANHESKNLVDVTKKIDPTRAKGLPEGKKIYLDRDIAHVMDYYNKLTVVGSPEAHHLLKTIDYVLNKWKAAQTIYFPAFHMRNFISDVFQGFLDGVPPGRYTSIVNRWHKRNFIDIDIGGHTYPMRKVLDSYRVNSGSGGFLKVEASGRDNLFRKASEVREDFGRYAHYEHALSQEYKVLIKKGYSKEVAFKKAEAAASYRVNKYHFDYGALTVAEQTFFRRMIPFYTFMRKAMPMLIESIFLNPSPLVKTHRAFSNFNKSEEDFSGVMYMDYLKTGAGFLGITGGETPWGITGSGLPQDVFNTATENPAAMLNPVAQLLFEIGTGKDTFSGKKAESWSDIFQNKMRIFSVKDKWEKDDVDWKEKLAYTLGLPVVQITKERQEDQVKQDVSEFRKKIKDIDETVKVSGMHIYLSSKNEIKVKDLLTGEITTYPNLDSALKALLPYENRVVRTNSEDQVG